MNLYIEFSSTLIQDYPAKSLSVAFRQPAAWNLNKFHWHHTFISHKRPWRTRQLRLYLLISNQTLVQCCHTHTLDIILHSHLNKHPDYSLKCLYPNTSQIPFLQLMTHELFLSKPTFLLLGDDLYLLLHLLMDQLPLYNSFTSSPTTRQSLKFQWSIHKYALFDVLDIVYLMARQYIFLSKPYHTHSRNNYFIVNISVLQLI